MKKIKCISVIALLLGAVSLPAQQKGLYLTVGGSLGANHYRYFLDNDDRSVPQLGFGGNLGVQYFFTKHWGLASGVGISYYQSKGYYANSWENDPEHYLFNGMYDDDFRYAFGDDYTNYALRLGLNDWREVQQGYFFEIPLMFMYQTKWGKRQSWGMYAGVGGKVQLPVISQTYRVKTGSELSVAAYYEKPDLVLPDPYGPDVSWHGYGTNSDTGYRGDMDVKPSFALSGEIGFLKSLSPRVDLMLGAYLDYGLNNIKDGNKTDEGYLIYPENNAKTIHPSAYVGDHLAYNGYVNSHAVDNVNLIGVGGKVGVRIRLGKDKKEEKPVEETKPLVVEVKPKKIQYTVLVLDSLTRKPMAAQVTFTCQNCTHPDDVAINSLADKAVPVDLHRSNKYSVTIVRDGFAPYHTELVTTSQKDIELVVPLRPQVAGAVKNIKDNALPGVNIRLTDTTGKSYETKTDAGGKYQFPSVDTGKHYLVIASKPGYMPDTLHLDIPAEPDRLQPVYNLPDIRLKPVKKMTLSATVLFDLDKFDLRAEAMREINAIIPMLKENPNIQIAVGGHTDSRGSAAHNLALSQNRANMVRTYMIQQGISPDRIKATGYGLTRLLNRCKPGVKCSEAEHQVNRRVEFIFMEKR